MHTKLDPKLIGYSLVLTAILLSLPLFVGYHLQDIAERNRLDSDRARVMDFLVENEVSFFAPAITNDDQELRELITHAMTYYHLDFISYKNGPSVVVELGQSAKCGQLDIYRFKNPLKNNLPSAIEYCLARREPLAIPASVYLILVFSFIGVFVVILVLYSVAQSKAKSDRLWSQSGEIAHDCEALLGLVRKIADNKEHSDLAPILRQFQKYIYKWRELSRGNEIIAGTELVFLPSLINAVTANLAMTDEFSHISFRSEIENLIWSKVNRDDFMGSILNLCKNSAQAISDYRKDGFVTVKLEESAGRAWITIQDNGKGMPAEAQAKLFQKGATVGKKNGSGLGLSTAKERFESWGGGVELVSSDKTGTKFKLELPLANPPNWYQGTLHLNTELELVHLDDSQSTHAELEAKLAPISHKLKVASFKTISDCIEYLKKSPETKRHFIIDYNLDSGNETGIDFIKTMGISSRSILMTSDWEMPELQHSAESLGLKILPKEYLKHAPIALIEASDATRSVAAVLIDDDEIVRKDWEDAASDKNLIIRTYASVADFMQQASVIPRETPIYIDSYLGNGLRGEVESKKIYERGFKSIYLTTFGKTKGAWSHILGTKNKSFPF